MEHERELMPIIITHGTIVTMHADAIVNAANPDGIGVAADSHWVSRRIR